MSTKINAGDTLTVGDLTDDYLGAFIEVGPVRGVTRRLRLDRVVHDGLDHSALRTRSGGVMYAHQSYDVTVITPPPVAQPEAPTALGQCIWIEESRELLGVVADPGDMLPIRTINDGWMNWEDVLSRAGNRQIVVSDPPRWPDETPEVPERIEVGEWPDDDTHLRAWKWIDADGEPWWWDAQAGLWRLEGMHSDMPRPLCGPWTRGERVK